MKIIKNLFAPDTEPIIPWDGETPEQTARRQKQVIFLDISSRVGMAVAGALIVIIVIAQVIILT